MSTQRLNDGSITKLMLTVTALVMCMGIVPCAYSQQPKATGTESPATVDRIMGPIHNTLNVMLERVFSSRPEVRERAVEFGRANRSAIESFRAHLSKRPDDNEARIMLGYLYSISLDYRSALRHQISTCRALPGIGDSWVVLARTLYNVAVQYQLASMVAGDDAARSAASSAVTQFPRDMLVQVGYVGLRVLAEAEGKRYLPMTGLDNISSQGVTAGLDFAGRPSVKPENVSSPEVADRLRASFQKLAFLTPLPEPKTKVNLDKLLPIK